MRRCVNYVSLGCFPASYQDSRKSAGEHLLVPLIIGKGGSHGDTIPQVLQSTTSSPSFAFEVQVSALEKLLVQ